jgi:Mrp family chromosome partitioning ATPase
MLHGVVQQFFREVAWDDVDYLIVDLPPERATSRSA